MRMCKFKMNKNNPVNIFNNVDSCDFNSPVWTMRYAHGDLSILSRMYPDVSKADLSIANAIQSSIVVYALPLHIREMQQKSLHSKFSCCDASMRAMRYFNVCSTCVVNGKVGP